VPGGEPCTIALCVDIDSSAAAPPALGLHTARLLHRHAAIIIININNIVIIISTDIIDSWRAEWTVRVVQVLLLSTVLIIDID